MTSELRPCQNPNCKALEVGPSKYAPVLYKKYKGWAVKCPWCVLSGQPSSELYRTNIYFTKEEAIKAWNRRNDSGKLEQEG
ncbi:MAG: Restriction alleviation protein Lar [Gammaproteobacteria bacterium]|jgi:hypothetical protein|nr:Restriction alleviation protein Lar [Gammaproteobacteria bacterium]